MNKKLIDNIYKWTLRFYYARILFLGIALICFSLTLLFTDFKIISQGEFNLFLIITTGIIGVILLIIGLLNKVETEHGIRNKWHEKDMD